MGNQSLTPLAGVDQAELEAAHVVGLPPRDMLATLGLSVLGMVNASATFSTSVSVLGLADATIT
jgi:hypothetical protein